MPSLPIETIVAAINEVLQRSSDKVAILAWPPRGNDKEIITRLFELGRIVVYTQQEANRLKHLPQDVVAVLATRMMGADNYKVLVKGAGVKGFHPIQPGVVDKILNALRWPTQPQKKKAPSHTSSSLGTDSTADTATPAPEIVDVITVIESTLVDKIAWAKGLKDTTEALKDKIKILEREETQATDLGNALIEEEIGIKTEIDRLSDRLKELERELSQASTQVDEKKAERTKLEDELRKHEASQARAKEILNLTERLAKL